MRISGDFKRKVLAREWLVGTFLNLASPVAVEVAGLAGFDWILIDHEHGPGGEDTLLHQLQAASATPAIPFVRIAANDAARIKRVLDVGAHGVMVPWVSTAAEAKAAASAMRYVPRGIRGVAKFHRSSDYGRDFEEYYLHSHEWLTLAVQIETPEAVANIDEIASVDGVDVLFVGPADLTYSLGIREQYDHPKFVEALRRTAEAARRHGKAAGIQVGSASLLAASREHGFSFASFGTEGSALSAGLKQHLAVLRAK